MNWQAGIVWTVAILGCGVFWYVVFATVWAWFTGEWLWPFK